MKYLAAVTVGFLVLFGPLVTVVRADLSADDVRGAIQRGVRYLQDSQSSDGTWTEYPGQPGGITALCTLALLNAGEKPDEKHVEKALNYLRRLNPKTTYVVSLQTMVLCLAEPEKDQVRIGRNVEWLEKSQIKDGPRKGSWSYPLGNGDGSNSQFALLALYEAQRQAEAGRIQVKIDHATWERARVYWFAGQNDDGSWGYYRPLPGTGTMTCAGIASLVIAGDVIHQADARVVGDRIDCCYRSEMDDTQRIENGIEWIRKRFSIEVCPGQNSDIWHLYYLYALERVGRLTARRFIGKHDWYREGADLLVRKQQSTLGLTNFWEGRGYAEDNRDIATSLALLFLSKGRRPVLLAKVKFGRDDDWNRRRNDVNNLTMYVESRWKRDLSWQVVDLEAASVDDLLQVPVLYLSGGRSPLPAGEEAQKKLAMKLRDYLDRGGFLFAEGDCCSTGFDEGFRRLMKLVFPEPEYGLKPLDPGHPVWHAEELVSPDYVRPLLGIEFGCRTSVIYAPADPPAEPRPSLSCLWELSRGIDRQSFSEKVQAQIKAGRALGINILAYATNREVKYRYEIPATQTTAKKVDKVERGKLYVAKLQHPGGCDAAPRALANLMEQAARDLKIRAEVHPTLLSIADETLFDYPVVFMHGRNTFRLTDQERARLKTYVERGGLIFSDAICANKAFSESFRREMAAIFPKNPLERIPGDAPIWTNKYGGFDLKSVTRRDPQPANASGPLKAAMRKVQPDLEGIKVGDRYGVVFSQFDLSCALEKHDSLECRGYIREDAARIGLNVLLYAMQQ